MKKIITAIAAGALTLSMAACNTPGDRAVGGAAIGGFAGAAIGGAATGRAGGALAGAAIGAAGGASSAQEPLRTSPAPTALSGRRRQRLLPLIEIAAFSRVGFISALFFCAAPLDTTEPQ